MKRRRDKRQRSPKERLPRTAGVQRDASGRLHLRLHRDPKSGQALVELTAPLFQEAWQNEVAAAAANTAYAILHGERSLEGTVALARNAMSGTSRLAEGLLARAPRGAVACKAGCDHCCYQSVGVTAPEALAILDHLGRTRTSEELSALRAHVAKRHDETRGLSATERFSPEHPCPFLVSASCSIYEARPLSCRGMNSLDASECATRLRDPEARAAFLAEGSGGHSYMEPIRAFHAISAGLQLGLAELFELDMRPLDLTAVMHLLLSDAALPEAWLRGESPFETARGGDSTGSLAVQKLSGTLGAAPRGGAT